MLGLMLFSFRIVGTDITLRLCLLNRSIIEESFDRSAHRAYNGQRVKRKRWKDEEIICF